MAAKLFAGLEISVHPPLLHAFCLIFIGIQTPSKILALTEGQRLHLFLPWLTG